MMKKLPVSEIMVKKPVTVTSDMTVAEAAKVMKRHGVGSLVVVEGKRPTGIITERDLMVKVIAEEKAPQSIVISSIMSSPVETIGPRTDVTEAAKKMAKLKIRRLPVVQCGELVGLVTERDVLRIAPSLIEITREFNNIGACGAQGTGSSGYCERCSKFSEELKESQGHMICPYCAD